MQSTATTVDQYLTELPDEQRSFVSQLREMVNAHLPEGFEEGMLYGMIGRYVPHSRYSAGYHCDPTTPLPFINLAGQKSSINLYHMGIYANPTLLDRFVEEYPKHVSRKLDMGKSCIRFKKYEEIPYDLIGELIEKMTVDRWIALYEKNYKKK